jgi:hypothetical protein
MKHATRGLVGILMGLLAFAAPARESEARSKNHRIRKSSRGVKKKRSPRRRCRRRGDKLVGLKYLHGGAVWIPAEARCGGRFPVVVLLHGNNTRRERIKSLGGGRNLEKWARRYLNGKLIRPLILAEPIHFGACAPPERRAGLPYLFTGRFRFDKYRKLLEAKLRRYGIRASSWSFIGHSGAACCLTMGMFAIQKVWPKIRVWASADGCYNGQLQAATVMQQFDGKATKVINACRGYPAYRGYKKYERTLLTRKAQPVRCDKRYYKTCRRHPVKRWFSYVTQFSSPADHGKVLVELFKTLVFHDYPSARRVALKKRRQKAARRRRLARQRRQKAARRRRLAARRRRLHRGRRLPRSQRSRQRKRVRLKQRLRRSVAERE